LCIQSRADALANRAKPGHGGSLKRQCGQNGKIPGHIMRLPSSGKTEGGFFVPFDPIPLAIEQLLEIRQILAKPNHWSQGETTVEIPSASVARAHAHRKDAA
jgi:hypothetical protein